MRSDENLPDAFRESRRWQTDPFTGESRPQMDRLLFAGPEYHRHDYSGHERNKLFLNRDGQTFTDLSGLSGADTEADSRSWCWLDYDRDGWLDIALVNANVPLLDLFRSRLGSLPPTDGTAPPAGFIAVRLVGGNATDQATTDWSNRDAIGARLTLAAGTLRLVRIAARGEGYAAQNSATLHIGIGTAATVDTLDVRWPSGRSSRSPQPIPSGSLVTIFENAADSPTGESLVLAPYLPSAGSR